MKDVKEPLIQIPLEGVESEHCALIVDKGLQKTEGITSHKVELNNRRALISGDSGVLTKAVQTIRDLGYGVNSVKKNIPVLQMSCASCAANVENAVRTLPGVISASVNYAAAVLSVEYLPNMIQAADIRQAVYNAGYDLFLETEDPGAESLEDIHRQHFRRLQRKTILAAVLTLPVVIIGMFFMNMPYANYIMWVLSTPVIAWTGKDFFINAWKQARHRSANMDTLVALGSGIAYIFSVFNTLYPQYWMDRGLHGHVYFEAAAVIITFILLGKLLEERAKGNTSAALRNLIGLQPKTLTVLRGEQEIQIPLGEVQKNDIVLVKPGEKIAVDGTVTSGNSYIDESMLSGEPVPVFKKENDTVFAGTINQKGSFRFRAEKVGSETMLAQIIRMVQDAQGSKAPVQKLADRIAGIFVPVVIGIALLTFVVWALAGGENGISQGLIAMATVLVIACPCALGLATPTAIMVGIGKAAEKGILIKDAESLESARKVNALILDKTGTITEGHPGVTDALFLQDEDQSRQVLFQLEKRSEHPLAEAVLRYLGSAGQLPLTHFESISGQGVKAQLEGRTWFAGNKKLLLDNGISIPAEAEAKATQWSSEAKTLVWFADEENLRALLAIADQVKESSARAVKHLQDAGIEVYMLTGDNAHTAAAVASRTGIKQYRAEVLPAGKADFVKQLQREGKVVAMAGDGINDSTALAQADVSIAMGKGSDIAMDVAKMTIISSDLEKIPQALELSRHTVATIRQNLFWAFVYNIIGIPLAAGVLYPLNGFLLNPMIAGAAMALSSVSVVLNSLRLKWKK